MAQKIVTYEVAKALKEAGYPQELPCALTRPTYLDAWLWLWREKKAKIDFLCWDDWKCEVCYDEYIIAEDCPDPEEAIAVAIDYLVENNLIK